MCDFVHPDRQDYYMNHYMKLALNDLPNRIPRVLKPEMLITHIRMDIRGRAGE
jgi:hypothetical protein